MNSFSQNNTQNYTFWNADMQAIAKPESREGWVLLKDSLPISSFFLNSHKSAFGVNANVNFELVRNQTYNYGINHKVFLQKYNNIKVEFGRVILDTYINETVLRGKVFRNNFNTTINTNLFNTTISQLQQMNDSLYFVEDIWYIQQNELVLASKYHTANINNLNLKYVVSKNDGQILSEINPCAHANPISLCTKQANTQTVNCEVTSNNYTLYNNTKKIGVVDLTNNLNNLQFYSSNINSANNCSTNGIINQIMFALESSYDYYLSEHSIDITDPATLPPTFLSDFIIKHDPNITNGFWHNGFIRLGLGRENLDFIGHEFTHAIREFLALNNSLGNSWWTENSTINESFCDFMGNMIERKIVTLQGVNSMNYGTNPWLFADGAPYLLNNHIASRNLSNPQDPNVKFPFSATKRYFVNMTHYEHSASNTGGFWNEYSAHKGFINYFYYLLSEGGSGTNDLGMCYNLQGIGVDNVEKIVLYLMSNLSESDGFAEFRNLALSSINTLFPNNPSYESELIEALKAIGFYSLGISEMNATGYRMGTFERHNLITYNPHITLNGLNYIHTDLTINNGASLTLNAGEYHIEEGVQITVNSGGSLMINNDANLKFRPNSGIKINYGSISITGATLENDRRDFCNNIFDSDLAWDGISIIHTSNLNISGSLFKGAKQAISTIFALPGIPAPFYQDIPNFLMQSNTFEDNYFALNLKLKLNTNVTILRNNFLYPKMNLDHVISLNSDNDFTNDIFNNPQQLPDAYVNIDINGTTNFYCKFLDNQFIDPIFDENPLPPGWSIYPSDVQGIAKALKLTTINT